MGPLAEVSGCSGGAFLGAVHLSEHYLLVTLCIVVFSLRTVSKVT